MRTDLQGTFYRKSYPYRKQNISIQKHDPKAKIKKYRHDFICFWNDWDRVTNGSRVDMVDIHCIFGYKRNVSDTVLFWLGFVHVGLNKREQTKWFCYFATNCKCRFFSYILLRCQPIHMIAYVVRAYLIILLSYNEER